MSNTPITRNKLIKLCNARNILCDFCEVNECEKCIVQHLIDDAHSECSGDENSENNCDNKVYNCDSCVKNGDCLEQGIDGKPRFLEYGEYDADMTLQEFIDASLADMKNGFAMPWGDSCGCCYEFSSLEIGIQVIKHHDEDDATKEWYEVYVSPDDSDGEHYYTDTTEPKELEILLKEIFNNRR